MSLKSKIEAVIYASEEPVTLQQLVGLLADEAGAELDEIAAGQGSLPLEDVIAAGISADDASDEATGNRQEGSAIHVHAEGSVLQGTEVAGASVSSVEEAERIDVPPEPGDTEILGAGAVSEESKRQIRERERAVRDHIRRATDALIRYYAEGDRGIEIREVASGFRMGTKPEYHDAVRGFVKSLKPALKLTLPALETLAVVAYKQPVTAAEISEIRGVDSAGVLGGLIVRKLIATAGRKQVIGRPMLYKTTRDFLLRFGLKDVQELPSMEEFERMAGELVEQEDLPMDHAETLIEQANARGDAEHIRKDEDEATESEAAQPDPIAIREVSEQKATAESAAGGTNGHTQDTQHRSTKTEALQPTEDGEHGSQTDHGNSEQTSS